MAEQRRELVDAGIHAVLGRAVASWEQVLEGSVLDPDEAAGIYATITVLEHQVQGVQRAVRGSLDLAESKPHSPALLAKISAAASTAAAVASSLNAALHCLCPQSAAGGLAGRSLSAGLQMATRFFRTSLQASSTLAAELAATAMMCRPNPTLLMIQAQP
ncbi:hypothetical protein IGS73_07595 [Janibacter indicus]|uniref:Uncharacterized protein n=1 Tax=Janibacter indicus TaxID=857417 RepID=A0A7L9J577_9MICO|nr:hypothetical protein [Janibacter indicus]QOK24213.1 hypothetical protein IGS73_07595 [Janibacter indicus]